MIRPQMPLHVDLATPVSLLVLIGGGEFSFGETREIDELLLRSMPPDPRTAAFHIGILTAAPPVAAGEGRRDGVGRAGHGAEPGSARRPQRPVPEVAGGDGPGGRGARARAGGDRAGHGREGHRGAGPGPAAV